MRWLPGGPAAKYPPAKAGDAGAVGLILGLRSPAEERATHSSLLGWETS